MMRNFGQRWRRNQVEMMSRKLKGDMMWFASDKEDAFAQGAIIATVVSILLLLTFISLALSARAEGPVSISGPAAPAYANLPDPWSATVTWTSSCNVTSYTPQSQMDSGAWLDGPTVGPVDLKGGFYNVSLTKGHLWRLRIVPTLEGESILCLPSIPPTPTNVLEYDLREPKGWCGVVIVLPILTVSAVYLGVRRRRLRYQSI